ncbi:MAG: BON domain-containing protein [Usitatibacter sp.]
MAHPNSLRATLAVALAASFVPACDRQATTEAQRSAEQAGQKIDNAVDRSGKRLAEAGEKTQQKLAEAGERMRPSLEEAGARISEASERVAASVKDAVAPNATTATTTTTITTGPSSSVSGLPAQTRAVLGDTAITASIRTDFLKDPDLSVLKIDVDTRDGVVTLNGLADNEAAKVRAEKIAAAIKGVREVRNFLTVKRV